MLPGALAPAHLSTCTAAYALETLENCNVTEGLATVKFKLILIDHQMKQMGGFSPSSLQWTNSLSR